MIMTDAEKDLAWRSLPEKAQAEIRQWYSNNYGQTVPLCVGFHTALSEVFGKHNLTTTKKERPRFEEGFMAIFPGMNKPLPIHTIEDGVAMSWWDDGSVRCASPIDMLRPYTEEQESKEDEHSDFEPHSHQIGDEFSTMSEETAGELVKCLAELDDSINKFKDSQVDWLSYRMELAKVISVAYAEKGRFAPEDIAHNTMLVVDDIVARLKGSKKE